jgi:putative ABC transport system permease protein
MIQFLIEAVTLSALGGVIGIVGGYLLAAVTRGVVARWIDLPAVHTPVVAILGACIFCMVLGVIFGVYPAA